MTDTIRCGWLPADNQYHLTRPGMSEGDRAAWKARHGCPDVVIRDATHELGADMVGCFDQKRKLSKS